MTEILEYSERTNAHALPEVTPFQAAETPRDLVAIDGSYSFLWNSSSLWLAVVKVGALLYRGGRIQGIQKFEKPLVISTQEGFAAEDDLQATLFRLTRGAKEQHREIVNELRKSYEHQLALEAAQAGEDRIVALDGSLASFPKETDRLGDVVRACEERGHLLVGVSKDSTTHAFGSALADEELLRPHEGMGFIRVPEEFEGRQRALLHGDVYFARLHAQAPKWFRVDLGTDKDAPEEALAQLAAYCASPLCVGYPRPLFEAHRFAVTIRQMREMYEDAIIKEGVRLGVPVSLLVNGLTNMEGAPHGTFHQYLDQVTRELK
ncbi:MAG: DNA double-strand break repair nuclease NurA [Thermoplasmata archaeon]|nr:DNA double-strand break repair nuclease NurA [Thermoplasmata archaeon]